MIASFKHGFVFIKTHKTAGSSIEVGIEKKCGPSDIVTPMQMSSGEVTNARNYHPTSTLGRLYAKHKLLRKIITKTSPLVNPWYWEHMPASVVRKNIGGETFDRMISFCFERNPWEKAVSYYQWKVNGNRRKLEPFQTWVQKKSHRLPVDSRLWMSEGKQIVTRVIDYRNFTKSLNEILSECGSPQIDEMPREKTGLSQGRGDYRDWYDSATRKAIEKLYYKEIEVLGYRFEDPKAARQCVYR